MSQKAKVRALREMTGINTLISKLGLKFVIPFYHAVSDQPLTHLKHLYRHLSVDEFRVQLEFLLKHIEFYTPDDFRRNIQNPKTSDKVPGLLTFDDGLIECQNIIRPILKELSIPAVFFINPGLIEKEEIFHRYKVSLILEEVEKADEIKEIVSQYNEIFSSDLKDEMEFRKALLGLDYGQKNNIDSLFRSLDLNIRFTDIYMDINMIQDLITDGHFIGGHSMDHPEFSLLTSGEKIRQIKDSLDYVEMHFNQSMKLFAFPFHDYLEKSDFYQKMFDDTNVDMSFGTSAFNKDPIKNSFQRLDMEISVDAEAYLRKKLMSYLAKKSLGRHKMKR